MALVDNLVSYWSLADTTDAHGSNNLTNNNTVTFVSGQVGNAANFVEASSQYLSVASNAGLEFGDADFTICAWVKLSDTSPHAVIEKWSGTTNGGYRISFATSKFNFTVRNSANNGNAVATWGSNGAANTWYFVAARHDSVNDLVSISVDAGTPVTGALSGGARVNTVDLNLGFRDAAALYLDGNLDEVAIWSRHLSDAEITELYNSGSGRDYAYVSGGGAAGEIPNWPTFQRNGFWVPQLT